MFIREFFAADLAPGSGGATEIDYSLGFFENLEEVIDLEEFVSGTGSVTLLFGLSVVNVLN